MQALKKHLRPAIIALTIMTLCMSCFHDAVHPGKTMTANLTVILLAGSAVLLLVWKHIWTGGEK